MSRRWETLIGLELHAQLRSRRKLFSGAVVAAVSPANGAATWFDLASPGTLPRLNAEPLKRAITAGFALNATIKARSRFVRKHYFYGDLPAGYQITQHDEPIAEGGSIRLDDGTVVAIDRIQLEQDSGKTVTDISPSFNLVDLNRAGVALIEIVTAPTMKHSAQAVQTVKQIQTLLVYLGVSDGVMANGNLRVDVNVSLLNRHQRGRRVEIKNLNSLKSIERAVDFEVDRQAHLLDRGDEVVPETRTFDVASGATIVMRSKEQTNDYRIFNDPDLPVLDLSPRFIESIRLQMPTLPDVISRRWREEHQLSRNLADMIASDRRYSSFLDEVVRVRPPEPGTAVTAANWMVNEVFGRLKASSMSWESSPILPRALRDLVDAINHDRISGSAGKSLLDLMMSGDERSVDDIIRDDDWEQVSDRDLLRPTCTAVINDHAQEVNDYVMKGNERKLNFLVGVVRKRLGSRANLPLVRSILIDMITVM